MYVVSIQSVSERQAPRKKGHVMDGSIRLIYWWRLTIHFCHGSITPCESSSFHIALVCWLFGCLECRRATRPQKSNSAHHVLVSVQKYVSISLFQYLSLVPNQRPRLIAVFRAFFHRQNLHKDLCVFSRVARLSIMYRTASHSSAP